MHPDRLFRYLLLAAALCIAAFLAAACAGAPGPAAGPGALAADATVPERTLPIAVYRETGVASWYGKELQGRKTASGEIFDQNGLTAAHRTLPFGTRLLVTNLENGKSVTVTVNDRGPFVQGRILELSLGAARELGFLAQGTARVRIETEDPVRRPSRYAILAATYVEKTAADQLKDRLSGRIRPVVIVPFATNVTPLYRVIVGSFPSLSRAEKVASKLRTQGLEPFIVRED